VVGATEEGRSADNANIDLYGAMPAIVNQLFKVPPFLFLCLLSLNVELILDAVEM
jgi:hypothetical protein